MKNKHLSLLVALAAILGISAYALAQADPGSALSESMKESPAAGPCIPFASVEMGDPIICETALTREGDPLFVRLFWDVLADTDELHVTRVETATSAGGSAKAVLSDLDSRAPLFMEANGFEFIDMNFDGYMDFRLIEFLPAGPNVAHINALYDPAKGRHVSAPALNGITATEFNAEDQTVISMWRGNAVTHGQDIFEWKGAELFLSERTISVFDENGNCMLTTYEPTTPLSASMLAGMDELGAEIAEISEEPC